ncbi:MAG: hypothetical protein ACOYOU_10720 [Kiritimatiellia bacterium]
MCRQDHNRRDGFTPSIAWDLRVDGVKPSLPKCSGKIQPADLVWTEEFGAAWRMASTVPDLVFAAHVIAPPPPPKTVTDNPANAEAYTSSTSNRELMSAARLSLKGNWGIAIGVTVVIGLIRVALSLLANIPLIGLVFSLGSLLTCGIGFLWLGPYMSMSATKFYEDLKPA